MANTKNTLYYTINNAKAAVPASANKTGTIKTEGKYVVGTSTLFMTEMRAGSWLTDLTNNELRRVTRVTSDTYAELDSAFSSDISAGTTPNVIPVEDLHLRELSVAIPPLDSGGSPYAWGEIDGETLPNGSPVTFGKNSAYNTNRDGLVDPLIANATGTLIQVTILR
jgi:hypothetical protein